MTEPIKLLIAEDQIAIRRSLASLFKRQPDIELVGEVGDGVEAARRAELEHPDVALLDIKMPRLNGIEAAKLIRAKSPATRVVMLTTFDTDDLVFEAILAGAIGYILKDTEENEILATVREAARGQSRMSPTIARRVLDDFRRIKPLQPAPTPTPNAHPEDLTSRERDILDLIGDGLSNREIGDKLSLAEGTVKNHVSNILSKLHARSRTELAVRALKGTL